MIQIKSIKKIFAITVIFIIGFSFGGLNFAEAQIIGNSCPGVTFVLKPRANSTTGSESINIAQDKVSTVVGAVGFNQSSTCPGYARLYYKWNKNSDPVAMNVSNNFSLFPNGTTAGKYEIELQLAGSKNFTDIYESKPVTLTVTKSTSGSTTGGTVNANLGGNSSTGGVSGSAGGTVPNTNVSANIGDLDAPIGYFFNPLQARTLPEIITALIRILFVLIGIASVIVIIIAGFRMVMANGSEDQITKAKKAITWAIIGLVVSLLSFSIVAIIQRLIQVGS